MRRDKSLGLPTADPALIAVAHLVRAMEERMPGITEEWLASFGDRDFKPEIIAASTGTLADFESGEDAAHWARLLRLMVFQTLGAPKERRRRR